MPKHSAIYWNIFRKDCAIFVLKYHINLKRLKNIYITYNKHITHKPKKNYFCIRTN